jgi:hypothetical protein
MLEIYKMEHGIECKTEWQMEHGLIPLHRLVCFEQFRREGGGGGVVSIFTRHTQGPYLRSIN